MNYHDTVPSEPGLYLIDGTEALLFHSDGHWYGHAAKEVFDVERFTPMLGPLPDTADAMLSLACELAFARMVVADYQWCSGNGTGPTTDEATRDVMPRL